MTSCSSRKSFLHAIITVNVLETIPGWWTLSPRKQSDFLTCCVTTHSHGTTVGLRVIAVGIIEHDKNNMNIGRKTRSGICFRTFQNKNLVLALRINIPSTLYAHATRLTTICMYEGLVVRDIFVLRGDYVTHLWCDSCCRVGNLEDELQHCSSHVKFQRLHNTELWGHIPFTARMHNPVSWDIAEEGGRVTATKGEDEKENGEKS
jgi:hypothetical protein